MEHIVVKMFEKELEIDVIQSEKVGEYISNWKKYFPSVQLRIDGFVVYSPFPQINVENIIHTTIGLYNSGSFLVNGVSSINLSSHIHYNIKNRFGRALFVDGVCVYEGNLSKKAIDDFIKNKLPTIPLKEKDTQPYN